VPDSYVVGVDLGTLSGRAVVVRTSDGAELGSAVHEYAHGVMSATLAGRGRPLPPDWALQVPADHLEALDGAVPAALRDAGVDPAGVVGIGVAATSSTVLPVLADGTPLCELPSYADRPHAYTKLWKHHAAQACADRLTVAAVERDEPWLARYGGRVSSEWALPKGLELFEGDREVYDATAHWVELADWAVWRLTGRLTRNAPAAGYKALMQDGAFPSPELLEKVAPGFGGFLLERMAGEVVTAGARAGGLSAVAASRLRLPEGIAVAAGAIDAHATAPAARAVEPGRLLLVLGTSTCHLVSATAPFAVPGMSGVVDGGIVPGLWGHEAGQSGVGDLFGWFVDNAAPARVHEQAAASGRSVHDLLTAQAADLAPGEHGLAVLDWVSGNRSVLVDHELSGLVLGLTTSTQPHEIYRALIEATAYGARVVVDAYTDAGLEIDEVVCAGGLVANELLLQVYADVLRRPLSVLPSQHGAALGAAIHAAVAAGVHPDLPSASEAMGRVDPARFLPDGPAADAYDRLYAEYLLLHDHFGRGANDVMRRLRAFRRDARRAR
jgi:L-ribulokinase